MLHNRPLQSGLETNNPSLHQTQGVSRPNPLRPGDFTPIEFALPWTRAHQPQAAWRLVGSVSFTPSGWPQCSVDRPLHRKEPLSLRDGGSPS